MLWRTTQPIINSSVSHTLLNRAGGASAGIGASTSAKAGPSCLRLRRSLTTTSRRSARTHGHSSHYDVLTLSKNSSKQQIKARFYELSKQYHPDAKGGDTAKFHEINDAYAVLGDDTKRRQYDLSLVPASVSHAHRHPSQSHFGSHSSFSPNDPYLHRAAQGPHRSWTASSAHAHRASASSGQAPRTENYTPFGRRTPPNFQYTYEYNFNYNPNARTTTRTRKRTGEEDPAHGTGAGGGGMWKFAVTVGLILVVISLGGGLTANSQSVEDWVTALAVKDGDEKDDARLERDDCDAHRQIPEIKTQLRYYATKKS